MRTQDRTRRATLAARFNLSYEQLDKLVFNGDTGDAAQCGRVALDDHWAALCQRLDQPVSAMPAFLEEFFGGDVLDQELVASIRQLRRRYKSGLLSNAFVNLRGLITDVWQMGDVFDAMIISAEEGMVKPNALIYQRALDRLQVAASEAVFIDDFMRNIDAARQVGLHAIHFQSPEQARHDLAGLLGHAI